AAAALILAAACSLSSGSGEDVNPACPQADALIEPAVGPEIDGQLVINEVMASNVLTALDEDGFAGDWIEIFNPAGVDVSLEGYGLTTALGEPLEAVIGAGVTVPAGGYLQLWLDEQP